MTIFYAVIAGPGGVILVEHATTEGNFQLYAKQIMENLPPGAEGKKSYPFHDYRFHTVVTQGITFICVAEVSFGVRIPFGFLEDIKMMWFSKYEDRGSTAIAYAMNEDFGRTLQQKMDFYSNDKSADKIRKINAQLELVKAQMLEDLEKSYLRNEEIELMVEKTSELKVESAVFKTKTEEVKKHMKWRNICCWVTLSIVGLVVVYGILAAACGGLSIPNCRAASSPTPAKGPTPAPTRLPTPPPSEGTQSPTQPPATQPPATQPPATQPPTLAPSNPTTQAPSDTPPVTSAPSDPTTQSPTEASQSPTQPPSDSTLPPTGPPTQSPTDPETQAPTASTQAPTDPVTQAPTSETQAPTPETQAPTPETHAPIPETQAPTVEPFTEPPRPL